MNYILVAGGDRRNIYLANSLYKDGFGVRVCGFDDISEFNNGIEFEKITGESSNKYPLIILGLPASKTGKELWSPFSDKRILLTELLKYANKESIIVGGQLDKWQNVFENHEFADYTKRCDFAYLNAVPTAEGAIECAMKQSKITLASSLCAITGFGRCSEILAHRISAFKAHVHIYARSSKDLSHASSLGYKAFHMDMLKENTGIYDIIFNTVPFGIFDNEYAEKLKGNCIFIDVASAPGGIAENVQKNNINYFFLSGLPGKYSPLSAAEIIKTVIMTLLKEKGKDARQWLLKE